ncbi:uncharacterized protein PAC_05536 [Phialocephala subalpina]|uniref:Clr5 domain-containing protein n=1 Tax=Phialocephala subalpina TaxID=576137 RepID=A0A1L7WSA2_9HELO|nr:uncharacterized protein PAC_05536 [Phialocephala subalpina]
MSKFEDIWVQLLPRATELRASGSTPQETCHRLALEGFRNKNKYNTVKGWYKRNFNDWPDEGDDTKSTGSGRRQSGAQYPPPSNHLAQTRIQYPQTYPQNEQYYKTPQALGEIQHQWPNGFSQQDNGPPQSRFQNAARHGFVERGFHGYQTTSQSPPRQQALQYLSNSPGVHPLSRQSLPPYHHLNQQDISYHNIPPSAVGDRDSLHQQGHLGSGPQPQQIVEAGCPARFTPLQQVGVLFDHERYQVDGSGIICDSTRSPAGRQEWSSPGYYESLLNMEFDAGMDAVGESVHLALGGQDNTEGTNAGVHGPALASHSHLPHAPQVLNNQRPSHLASKSLVMSPPHRGVSTFTNQQHVEGTCVQQVEHTYPMAGHSRNSTVFRSTIAPRHVVPPNPPQNSPVLRRRGNQPSWHPILLQDSSIVAISPDGFSTDLPRKRVRRQPGSETQRSRSLRLSETRDSIDIYHDQRETANSLPASSSTFFDTRLVTTRKPLSNQPVKHSNTSVHSSVRDSGYVSLFESVIEETLRNSLNSLKLTDEPKFKYRESIDGYVDVKVKTNWRVRRSYILSMDLQKAQVDA